MIDKLPHRRNITTAHRRALLAAAVRFLCHQLSFLISVNMASLASSQGGGDGRRPGRPRGSKNKQTAAKTTKPPTKRKKAKGRVDAEAPPDESDGGNSNTTDTRAVWTKDQERTLINYLHSERAAMGEGGFRSSIWHGATAHLNATYPEALKTKEQVERKYGKGVSTSKLLIIPDADSPLAQGNPDCNQLCEGQIGLALRQRAGLQHRGSFGASCLGDTISQEQDHCMYTSCYHTTIP